MGEKDRAGKEKERRGRKERRKEEGEKETYLKTRRTRGSEKLFGWESKKGDFALPCGSDAAVSFGGMNGGEVSLDAGERFLWRKLAFQPSDWRIGLNPLASHTEGCSE